MELPIRRVAVLGAGPAHTPDGMTLALLFRRAGFDVVLEDMLPGNLRRARAALSEADEAVAPHYATSVEDAVRQADLVLDTVPDELESKLEIFSLLDRMAPPRAIFLTPTRLSIADLASCTCRPAQCFALEFEEGVSLLSRVTVVATAAADEDAIARVRFALEALGAVVGVRVDDARLP